MTCRWIVLALLVAIGGACERGEADSDYAGTIEFRDVAVGSLVGGRVLDVRKREGERARRGEVLVVLDPEEWQHVLDEADAHAEAIARELDRLEAGPRPEVIERARADAQRLKLLWEIVRLGARKEEIAEARENVAAADALVTEADEELAREQTLLRKGSSTASNYDRALAGQKTAHARKAAAEQRVRLLEHGARPEEIEVARQAYLAQQATVRELEAGYRAEDIAAKRATLDAARARSEVARYKLKELRITAPADCIVQTLDLRAGDLLQPGQAVAILLLEEAPWITIYLPERDVARVQLGEVASVVPDGHAPVEAVVTWISREAEYTPRNVQTRRERMTQVFRVKLEIRGDASRLKDGMWADVTLP